MEENKNKTERKTERKTGRKEKDEKKIKQVDAGTTTSTPVEIGYRRRKEMGSIETTKRKKTRGWTKQSWTDYGSTSRRGEEAKIAKKISDDHQRSAKK